MGQIDHVQNEPSTCGVARWGRFQLELALNSFTKVVALVWKQSTLSSAFRCATRLFRFLPSSFSVSFVWLSPPLKFSLWTHIPTHSVVCHSPSPCPSRAPCHRPFCQILPFRLVLILTCHFAPSRNGLLRHHILSATTGEHFNSNRPRVCQRMGGVALRPPPLARTSHDTARSSSPLGETIGLARGAVHHIPIVSPLWAII